MSNYKFPSEEERKERLNFDIIATALRVQAKRYVIATLLLVLLFFCFLCIFWNVMNTARIIGMCLLVIITCIVAYNAVIRYVRISKRKFKVEIDTLTDIRLKVYQYSKRSATFGRIKKYSDILVFEKHGEYAIEKRDILDYTKCGDTFYIVIYDEKKPKPTLIYNTRMYEWRE